MSCRLIGFAEQTCLLYVANGLRDVIKSRSYRVFRIFCFIIYVRVKFRLKTTSNDSTVPLIIKQKHKNFTTFIIIWLI